MTDDEPIIREIFIEATPEEVFPYLTQSDKYVLWMGLTAHLDPRPGGIYQIDPNTRDIILGEFIEVVPGRFHRATQQYWVAYSCMSRENSVAVASEAST